MNYKLVEHTGGSTSLVLSRRRHAHFLIRPPQDLAHSPEPSAAPHHPQIPLLTDTHPPLHLALASTNPPIHHQAAHTPEDSLFPFSTPLFPVFIDYISPPRNTARAGGPRPPSLWPFSRWFPMGCKLLGLGDSTSPAWCEFCILTIALHLTSYLVAGRAQQSY